MEPYLVASQRTLIDGKGEPVILEQTAAFWEQFDALVDEGHFSVPELIQFGHDTVEEFRFPFCLGIQDAVGHLYKDRFVN